MTTLVPMAEAHFAAFVETSVAGYADDNDARAALESVESLTVAMGLSCIGLHVFGHAPGAQALYSPVGYSVAGINMQKRLPTTGA